MPSASPISQCGLVGKGCLSGFAPGARDDVVLLVGADGHGVVRQVRDAEHELLEFLVHLREAAVDGGDLLADAAALIQVLDGLLGLGLLRDELADLIATGLAGLGLLDKAAALLVERENLVDDGDVGVAVGEFLADEVGCVAEESDVEHGTARCFRLR